MNQQIFAKFSAALFLFLGSLSPLAAREDPFPFEPTPGEFTKYLNSNDYNPSEGRYYFYNPRQCKVTSLPPDEPGHSYWVYKCILDYDLFTSLGKRTCIGAGIRYKWSMRDGKESFNNGTGMASFPSECGEWEKVSVPQETVPEPEPQLEPDPELPASANEPKSQAPAKATNPDEIVLTRQILLAGGAGIFLFGGLLGIGFSRLFGIKKK